MTICLVSQVFGTWFGRVRDGTATINARPSVFGFIAAVSAVAYCLAPFLALLYGLAGVGLLKRWGWARVLALGLSFITAVVAFPLGTLVAVPVIIQLFKPEVKAAFVKISPSPTPPMPPQP